MELANFRSMNVRLGQIDIHFLTNGTAGPDGKLVDEGKPVILFLHGFPEFHGSWAHVAPFLQGDYLLILPDQRGYNLSSAPQEVEAYQTKLLAQDMIDLLDCLIPAKTCHLVGHDWGASVAYALAMKNPDRFSTLNIINGVHPICFQKALVSDLEQVKASQYIHVLKSADASERMSANNFAKTMSMFEKFSEIGWLSSGLKSQYLEAWGQTGRFNAMLNWYRASPLIVPKLDEFESGKRPAAPLLDVSASHFNIEMPHLLIWGLNDTALLPISHDGLDQFAKQLKVVEIIDAGHWVNHTHAERVALEIDKFIGTCP